MLVFVPLTADELAAWAQTGHHRPARGYAVTPSLSAAFGFGPADAEDAEHTALHIAGLAGLLDAGRRLVAVAEASATPVASSEFGQVRLGALPWSSVTALFADDDPGIADDLRGRLGGVALEAAWDDPVLAEEIGENELLWHGASEWQALL